MAVAVGVANGTQVASIVLAALAAERFGTLVPLGVGMALAAGVCLYVVMRPVGAVRTITEAPVAAPVFVAAEAA